MDLALDVGVSPRHLSFVETGRSNPSPDLLLTLSDHLAVPLPERNALLLAAGYAPRYQRTALDDASMARIGAALNEMLARHDPYPGLVIDQAWDVLITNRAAQQLAAALPAELVEPRLNVFRACLHPDGLARYTRNFEEWAGYLLAQLHRLAALTADPELSRLADEVGHYPTVAALSRWRQAVRPDEPALLIPWQLALDGVELSFFTTITTFGTALDITLAELAVELFYPADDRTEAALRRG